MNTKPAKKNLWLFAVLVMIVIGIGLLHAFTPGHLFLYHDTYRRLSYFPITLGALWFGITGGIILALLTSAAFIPHLLLFWAHGPQAYYSELSEILFYLCAGVVVGIISSRESRLRESYRRLSEKLKRSYDRLHEQAKQLIEAEEQLGQSQKLSVLGHLSASLAHEIKNPLASIRGTAEILIDDFPKGHEKHEFIQIMLSEISRLNNSVEDVLQYCRGQVKARPLELEFTEAVLKRVLNILENPLKKRGIHLEVIKTGEPYDFKTDGAKLSQVLMNILLNAIDAVPEQGKIIVELIHAPDQYAIAVSDNGLGIAKKERNAVFQPFITYKEGGNGLGLYISKKIISSLKGTITVTRSKAGGACFSLIFPNSDGDFKRIVL